MTDAIGGVARKHKKEMYMIKVSENAVQELKNYFKDKDISGVRVYGRPSADPAGGTPEHIPLLARAAVAAGCDGLFLETHPEPAQARCDASSMLPLARLEELLRGLLGIHRARLDAEAEG